MPAETETQSCDSYDSSDPASLANLTSLTSLNSLVDSDRSCHETIAKCGFRFTKQRQEVYQALLVKRDHPTATEVYERVKLRIPSISLATVYNCLETLTECGLAKHVNFDREPSRYCPNLEEHGHFYCNQCGTVIDVPFKSQAHLEQTWEIPKDSIVIHHDAAFRGLCPQCAQGQAGPIQGQAASPQFIQGNAATEAGSAQTSNQASNP